MKFLVKWSEGYYGDARPEVVALDEIKESSAWDLTDDVIDTLSSLEVGHEYFHYELGSTLNFIKL
jgi:orotidine-5'-phosphate decarboxylase